MKKYLIKNEGQFYKANLHCHSTMSDGNLTPKELKDAYKSHGYSILSITDHEILLDHSDLNDKDFYMLPGYEIEIAEDVPSSAMRKLLHANLFPIDKNNLTQVCYNHEYVWGRAKESVEKIKFNGDAYIREHTVEGVNEMVRIARENGFLVTFNHPVWSLEEYNDYINYEGFFAMEILNYGCCVPDGLDEYSPTVYDAMLRHGKRLYCIATDDNHNQYPLDTARCDSFGGFTMIKATSLTHEAIIDSLQKGEFYASGGPLIHSLYIEDDKIHISCSDARIIRVTGASRRAKIVVAESGETITEAVMEIPAQTPYFRIEVVDKEGKVANTRAYFLDEV